MPPSDLRQALGRAGEQLAADHLERLGYAIVARNHRTRHGELDVVAAGADVLVFAEVKTRREGPFARPWDALHARKQAQVRRMAAAFLAEVAERPRLRRIRFDAIGVTIDARGRLVALDHIEGAF
jgi:putative endonuclease